MCVRAWCVRAWCVRACVRACAGVLPMCTSIQWHPPPNDALQPPSPAAVPCAPPLRRYDGWVTEMSNDPAKVRDLKVASGIDNLLYSADTYFRWARLGWPRLVVQGPVLG